MYTRPKRLGCCSSGSVGFGGFSGDPPPGTPQAVVALTMPPAESSPFPWKEIFAVSIASGLALHFLTGKKRR
jgi:hypothetical protein